MLAKLIVLDIERERRRARMLRALREYELERLETLPPFHEAIPQTPPWSRAEPCRDLIEDRNWPNELVFPAPALDAAKATEEGEKPKVEQDYTVEVPAGASTSR